jgi:hypothetical protein
MTVLIVYTVLVLVFETLVFTVGIALDSVVGEGWNLILAMVMFFGVIALMWPVAVFITERWLVSAQSAKHGHAVHRAAPSK